MSGDTPIRVAVVLAGGSGERFWPLSRQHRPKQLLKLADPARSMLEQTLDRIRPLFPLERTFIVTGTHLAEPIRTACPGFPPENVLAEPAKRNTAGALIYAAAALLAKFGDRNLSMAVFTADHRIGPDERFRQDVRLALETAEKEGGLVVIGIPPARPATGFGYIEVSTTQTGKAARVQAFREKPDQETAARYAVSGRHFWNSGMFFWRLDEFCRELAAANPGLEAVVRPLADALGAKDSEQATSQFSALENISIDFALMEKARKVWMIPAGFGWDDLGTWESLQRSMTPDQDGNVTAGDPVLIGTKNSVVVSDAPGTAVAVVGMDNVVVAVTADGVLVVPAGRSQDVAKAVAELKRRGAKQV